LSLSMVDNIVFQFDFVLGIKTLLGALALVIFSSMISFILSLYLSKKLFTSKTFPNLALSSVQNINDGFISVDANLKKLIGKKGVAATVLRPAGKVEIENEIYDARSEIGFIDRGDPIIVIKDGTTQLYVVKDE
ncbi:MAG: NfeD family protein, partial [Bacteroidales bacterium]|nr:NfeD family protein [Bacteroidales bacterium]